jgi:hypothetical protein
MESTMLFKRYAVMAIFLATTPAYAEWPPQAYSQEYDACVPACDKNNPSAHDKCTAYCHCVMDEMQTQFPDHAQLVRELTQEKRPDRMATTQMIANTCNQKIWGVPAKKLEFK